MIACKKVLDPSLCVAFLHVRAKFILDDPFQLHQRHNLFDCFARTSGKIPTFVLERSSYGYRSSMNPSAIVVAKKSTSMENLRLTGRTGSVDDDECPNCRARDKSSLQYWLYRRKKMCIDSASVSKRRWWSTVMLTWATFEVVVVPVYADALFLGTRLGESVISSSLLTRLSLGISVVSARIARTPTLQETNERKEKT